MQRPVRITQETPRGGGLDLFPKKKNLDLDILHPYLESESDSLLRFLASYNGFRALLQCLSLD